MHLRINILWNNYVRIIMDIICIYFIMNVNFGFLSGEMYWFLRQLSYQVSRTIATHCDDRKLDLARLAKIT